MAAVKLDQRVMVQQLVLIPDAGGGQARNWTDFREVWAQVRWKSVSRDGGNGQTGLAQRAIITLRWAPDYPDPMRLVIDQRALRVLSRFRRKIGAGDFLEIEGEDTF
ncbi:MAG: head-tail adaptor protein [Robiginitomaculum sp.]|nr:head-tail adaptor protein [Robiginitomaculum sp.]MDQ7077311.1 head-tail adaptor protein [Robiginitomaculum sp.]